MRRISPATIIATVALIFAVTGTATAAGLIDGAALKGNLVTSAKIRNSSLQAEDLSTSARIQLRGQTGPQGTTGDKGDKGDKGDPGTQGLTPAAGAPPASPATRPCSGHHAPGQPQPRSPTPAPPAVNPGGRAMTFNKRSRCPVLAADQQHHLDGAGDHVQRRRARELTPPCTCASSARTRPGRRRPPRARRRRRARGGARGTATRPPPAGWACREPR